ncbi:N-acetyl-gamma-glutamyl-phosphate reductase [Ferrimonas lipolytica]|uniref:N-acetyl-gamma-glutamyl-phosphate reductase n=1 Tax=Ferrimonas lipolytica TaxID=2724191 RepID=A0A6H1UI45_9GAMM|nr:N-acetyl-gamma-glutamyl-phosphate reductase [Ferrimonas lipolytica]QIZ78498.1 N-acetyl-gamma-glutamyl-phosphate reductase [Ferrimonas lipolytica]
MVKVAVIGASGYTGAELARLIQLHPQFELTHLYVSAGSVDKGKPLAQLYPNLIGTVDLPLLPLDEMALAQLGNQTDAVCLALDHLISAELAPKLLALGLVVFDLSGGHRFADASVYSNFYGFEHPAPELLTTAAYGLAEWQAERISAANLIAVAGCYPTASLSALKPLKQAGLISDGSRPVINAVSGVTGAGRKATINNSFCQVSLTPYGVLGHRHQPEIELQLDHEVVFTPHLGAFKRGILATITVQVPNGTTAADIDAAYSCYNDSSVVQLLPTGQWPKIDDVANTPNCLLSWKLDAERGVLVVVSAIDNLLKGAASQALQCMNIRFAVESGL